MQKWGDRTITIGPEEAISIEMTGVWPFAITGAEEIMYREATIPLPHVVYSDLIVMYEEIIPIETLLEEAIP